MSTANHIEIRELIDHLDDHLSTVKAAEPDFYEWSDADQLRGIAVSLLDGAHQFLHVMHGAEAVDVQVPRTLLRVAARLDTIDEEET